MTEELSSCFRKSLQCYFDSMEGEAVNGLHRATIEIIEKDLIKFVLDKCNYNYSSAAKMLGINRTTLRRKSLYYKIGS